MTATATNDRAQNTPSPCFRLKGGLFPLTVLEISHFDYDQFATELADKVAEAPAFFQQAPVILNVEGLAQEAELELAELVALCRQYGLVPVGLRGAEAALQEQARQQGVALIAERQRPSSPAESTEPAAAPAPEPDAVREPKAAKASPSKIVTAPVRSGQQVYAPGGDLIVMATVSPGSEILADGNIHVYGSLRGRALAGVQGDTSARIFCHSLEAELVSIAGHFQLNEAFRDAHGKRAVQISLNEQSLSITPLL